ncbi:MAG: HAD family hydrolase [Pseudomonadota bacterium]
MIRALLFDKDGTLFHYERTWGAWGAAVILDLASGDAELAGRMAEAVGFDLPTQTFRAGSLIVGGSAGEVNAALADQAPGLTAQDVDRVARHHLTTLPNEPVCDLPVLFSALRDAGYALGIATNDYETVAHQQLAAAGITGHFSFVCGYDSGFGAKPGPGMVEGFAAHLGLPLESVAMVGDSTHDLRAGRAARAGLTVAVLTGPADRGDLVDFADHVIEDISELPALLDGLSKG